jgi:hypothetical protein
MTIYRQASLAYLAGRDAAVAGRPHRNPYNGNAETAVERVLSITWARGYSAGNPMPRPLDPGA